MKYLTLIALSAGCILTSSCSSDPNMRQGQTTGAIVGGLAGGLLTDSWGGAVAGAAVGGLVGGEMKRKN
jgi:hypothetical protein